MKRTDPSFFPTISLNKSKRPLYRSLYEWFRDAIIEGKLRAGQGIPSTRAIASELGISRLPVMIAFEQLQAEGFLESIPSAGTVVANVLPSRAMVAIKEVRSAGVSKGREPSRAASQLCSARKPLWLDKPVAFRLSAPATEYFPISVWSSLLSRRSRAISREQMLYSDTAGYLPLREAISRYLNVMRGVQCNPDQVLIVSGSQQALHIAAQALLNQGDTAWMEDPGYKGAKHVFTISGVQQIPITVDAEGLRVEEGILKCNHAKAVYTTPSHQYPLGYTMSASRRLALLEWASRARAWIFEDDFDSEFRFGGTPLASLQGLDRDGRVIYIGTFSKVLFPSIRLGYMVVPLDLVKAFCAVRDAIDIFPPTLVQMALTDFIEQGYFARHIRRMKAVYSERRTVLISAIHSHLNDLVQITNCSAGLHLTAAFRQSISDQHISQLAARQGLSVAALSDFYDGHVTRSGMVLGFGAVDHDRIPDAIARLGKIIREDIGPTSSQPFRPSFIQASGL